MPAWHKKFNMISFVKKFSLFTIQYGIPVYNETIYHKKQQIIFCILVRFSFTEVFIFLWPVLTADPPLSIFSPFYQLYLQRVTYFFSTYLQYNIKNSVHV
jgi:hypothetical protein